MGKIYIQPEALKAPMKMFQTWPGWADKNFQGGTIFLAQSLKNLRIKKFSRGKFFFTGIDNFYFSILKISTLHAKSYGKIFTKW